MPTLPHTVPGQEVESLGSERFQIKRRLGEGSMGAVYLAYDRERGMDVALKSLRRVDAMSIYRFKREFRALSDMIHPNLVALYDLFQEGDNWYFTMEHVEGVDFLSYVLGVPRHAIEPTPRTTPEFADPFGRRSGIRQPQPLGLELLFPTPLRDEERLRAVLIQIVHALLAIHAAGKLHRDLKSDNVLVTPAGRAKVLDFGIVAERAPGPHGTLELGVLGTPAYMSPEQAGGRPVTEATDWYALGAMLYEALTGNVPFDGSYLEVMSQKQQMDPPPPSHVVSGVPEDLDELCMRLLQRHPPSRPDGPAILRALERRRPPSLRPPGHASISSMPAEPDAPFVGRGDELKALRRHLGETDRGRPIVTLIHGPSGIGKTTLVEHFVSEMRQGERAVALKGRCYEREAVPFKAFDSLVDSLSRHLRRLPSSDASEVLPRDILSLAHLFPVLRRVDVVAMARRRVQPPGDRQELRRHAFAALKEMLCRLADRSPLVLFIDDLQWGDVDSAHLIHELLRGPDAPSLLLILTYRSGEAATSACLQALFQHIREQEEITVHELELPPLGLDESTELAQRLIGPGLRGAASAIGEESQGNPHLLTELVRHVVMRKQNGGGPSEIQQGLVSFERALMKRVAELSPGARTLLELLSVAGRPVPEESLGVVSSFGVDLQKAVAELRGAKLARGVGSQNRRAVETYHDRVREAVLAAMEPSRLDTWHKRLASTLEATGSDDLEAIVEHLLGTGDSKRAQIYAIRAATQAADALAFEKAARLFAIAVENQDDQGWGHELLVRWADSLCNAGHGRQAAAVYFEAAQQAAPGAEAEGLRRKAGLQLLLSGHEQEAFELLGRDREALGVAIPERAEALEAELAALRASIGHGGFALAARTSEALAPEQLAHLETLWAFALWTAQTDPERARLLGARFARDALEAGDPLYAVRGLCLYHVVVDVPQSARERRSLQGALAVAEAIERHRQHPDAHARVQLAHGFDMLARGEFKLATRAFMRAEELFASRCPGSWVEMRIARAAISYLLAAFYQVERLSQIEQWLSEAEEHEDWLASASLRPLAGFALLVADQPERAARELEQAAARRRDEPTSWAGALHALARGQLALYRGDAVACAAIAAGGDGFMHSVLGTLPLLCGHAFLLRARAGLVAAAGVADAEALLQRVEADVRAVAAFGLGCFEQHVRLVRAGVAVRRSDPDTALAILEAVLSDRGEQPDLAFTIAAAEYRKAELMSTRGPKSRLPKAAEALRAQGVANPEAFVRLLAPGF